MQNPLSSSNDFSPNGNPQNSLKEFQSSGNSEIKTGEKVGEKMVLQCEQIINSSYFIQRNERFAINRAIANGRMDITKFMDFFNINGTTNYANISWKAIMIVSTSISRFVGRFMTKKQKASVTGIDDISINKKKEMYSEALLYLYNKEALLKLQEESGEQVIPKNQFIPDSQEHLDLWVSEELRLPEEIKCEIGIDTVMSDNGFGDMGVNTRRLKKDSCEVGLIGVETTTDKNGKILIDYLKPEDIFYSYSDYDDFRDSSIKGVIRSWKISELRNRYPKLSLKEVYEIAKYSKQWNANSKITFDTGWNTNMYLPIDDWNVDVVSFTVRSLDEDKSLIKTGTDGKLYVDKVKKRIEDVYPGNEYIEKTIWNIYRGVYVRQSKKVLEWGLEKNQSRPQSYNKISEAYSPFSFYMYNNVQMRNLAIPEKVEEPVEQMILARLKIQQMVAKLRPSGLEYDIDGLQEMDLGNGNLKPLELMKVTDQTGNVYKRSKDAEGNRIENPVKELANVGGVAQLESLIATYNFHLQVYRDEIGSNEFSEGQTIKPRVGVENVQTSMEVSFNSTDYMNDACVSLMDEVSDRIVCYLHDSIEFGSTVYRQLMDEVDVKGRDFKVKIELLPSTEEITKLMQDVDVFTQTHQDFILYISPLKIRQLAKVNIKLANIYFEQGQKKAINGAMQNAAQQSKMNADNQIQSAQAAEQAKQQSMQMEIQMKSQMEESLSAAKQKEIIITMIGNILAKGLPVPAEWKQVEQEIITNIGIPLFAQNVQMAQQMQQGVQDQQEGGGQERMESEQGMQEPQQQEQMEAQPMQ